jgi:hypothetical protein
MDIELVDESGFSKVQRARRFAPLQMTFLHEHVAMLLRMGVIRRSSSAVASPVVLVRKADGTWRMCVDLRRVNANTKPMRWPLPKIQELLPHLAGATAFASFDLLRGFWQFPVGKDSTHCLAFVTHEGLFEFTRLVMGARNSAGHFQKVMTQVLSDLVLQVILLYIDDILVYARTAAELVAAIRQVFDRLRAAGIFLKPSKCDLFCRELVWCGHHISEAGIGVNPQYVDAVREMAAPVTAADLQQFLGSCGWVRGKIPAYAELVAPLQQLLTAALAGSKKRNARAAARIALRDAGWGEAHAAAFEAIKAALAQAVTLAHLRDDMAVCLFPDASTYFWGSILTQVPPEDVTSGKPVETWRHEPLGFLSGAFKGASLNWAIPDKEGYSIKESCARFAHFLVREGGFFLFTDHRNLKFIFNPCGVVSQVSKPQADRLERWAVFMRAFEYVIEHIPGDANIWADMLSRWAAGTAMHLAQRERVGQGAARTGPLASGAEDNTRGDESRAGAERAAAVTLRVRRDRVLTEARHTRQRQAAGGEDAVEPSEKWPTLEEIRTAQEAEPGGTDRRGLEQADGEGGLWQRQGKVYVPAGQHRLRARIMVVAHAGAAGHRGQRATLTLLRQRFHWPGMERDAREMVASCLLCAKTRGGQVQPRPMGQAVQGAAPGEALHLDYVSMAENTESGAPKGLLVLKDGFSGHVTLWPAEDFDGATTEEAVVAWAAMFGVPSILVTDGASHFDNELVKALVKRFRAAHHITTAYAPWANGAIERVMRELVHLFRVLLAEANMPREEWHVLVPVVQATLNQTQGPARAGYSPNQLVFGRETPRPLDTVAVGRRRTEDNGEAAAAGGVSSASLKAHYNTTAAALQESWVKAEAAREHKHRQNEQQRLRELHEAEQRRAARGRPSKEALPPIETPQYAVGEYVLAHSPVRRNKLRVEWLGPYRVVDTINAWVYVLQDVVNGKRKSVHVNRMRWYADEALAITEDLKNQVAYDSQFNVDKVVDWRETDEDALEVRVRWLGFESNEDSWEPASRLHEDVPDIVERYLASVENECDKAGALLRAWGAAAGRARTTRRRRRPVPR